MMTKEEYKKEIVRMLDSLRINKYKGRNNCNGVDCKECPLQGFEYGCSNALSSLEIYCAVEKWSKEHPPKKYKVSQLEYDILKMYSDNYFYYFYESELLKLLLEKGHFKGATKDMKIKDYFDNCEVKEDV